MAEDKKSGAKSELGNLFVDIGSTGLGGLIKGLNSLNASFLLTKKGAESFTKPIINMSKNAGQGLIGLEKINAVTGITIEQLQSLKLWAAESSVDFGNFISQVGSLQQNLLNIQLGKGGNMTGFALLGIDPRSLDYNKPLEALDIIKAKVQQLDEATGALALKELGLSSDLLFAWNREKIKINEKLLLNKEEQKNIDEQNNAWKKLGATWEAVSTKIIAKFPIISMWINKITEKLENLPTLIDKVSKSVDEGSFWAKTIDKMANSVNNAYIAKIDKKIAEYQDTKKYAIQQALKTKNNKLKEIYVTKAEEADAKIKALKKKREDYLPKTNESIYDLHQKRIGSQQNNNTVKKVNPLYQSYDKSNTLLSNEPIKDIPPSLKNGNNSSSAYDLGAVPQAALSQNSNNFEINITQNITGQDAVDIASISSDKIEDAFSSIERQISSSL